MGLGHLPRSPWIVPVISTWSWRPVGCTGRGRARDGADRAGDRECGQRRAGDSVQRFASVGGEDLSGCSGEEAIGRLVGKVRGKKKRGHLFRCPPIKPGPATEQLELVF